MALVKFILTSLITDLLSNILIKQTLLFESIRQALTISSPSSEYLKEQDYLGSSN